MTRYPSCGVRVVVRSTSTSTSTATTTATSKIGGKLVYAGVVPTKHVKRALSVRLRVAEPVTANASSSVRRERPGLSRLQGGGRNAYDHYEPSLDVCVRAARADGDADRPVEERAGPELNRPRPEVTRRVPSA